MRRASWLFVVGMIFVEIGCGGQKPVYPVSGKVVSGADKKPAVGAMVIFTPVVPDAKETIRSMGTVGEDGSYAVTTHKAKDGAPAGEYTITLIWPAPKKSVLDEDGGDLLSGAFADNAKSKLRFTVQAAKSNEVPVIELP